MKLHKTLKKKKEQPARSGYASEARKNVAGDLAHIAGIERVKSRDPVHHLIEHSRDMFDLLGRVNAEKMMNDGRTSFDAVTKELNAAGTFDKEKQPEKSKTEKNDFGLPGLPGSEKETENAGPGGDFYKRFSEIAFSKGRLLCAVGQGGGETMMASCIRRTIDQSPPSDSRQTEVRKHGATKMRVPDSRASLSYHQYTRSALSLVVNTAQNMTKTLEIFERLASNDIDSRLGLPDIDTAYRMYPFLNTQKEKEKINSYREELRIMEKSPGAQNTGGKKAALESGINRLNTIIAHKNRMRINFLFELRKILADSRRAEELFSQQTVEEEIVKKLTEAEGIDDGENGEDSEKHRER